MENIVTDMRSRLSAQSNVEANTSGSKYKSRIAKLVACCLGVVVALVYVAARNQISASHEASEQKTSTISALDKMAVVFKGSYTRDQVDTALSRVMVQFGEPLTEANYNRWGSVLVRMRKESKGVSEMEILNCMREMRPPFKMDAAAALCTAARESGL